MSYYKHLILLSCWFATHNLCNLVYPSSASTLWSMGSVTELNCAWQIMRITIAIRTEDVSFNFCEHSFVTASMLSLSSHVCLPVRPTTGACTMILSFLSFTTRKSYVSFYKQHAVTFVIFHRFLMNSFMLLTNHWMLWCILKKALVSG